MDARYPPTDLDSMTVFQFCTLCSWSPGFLPDIAASKEADYYFDESSYEDMQCCVLDKTSGKPMCFLSMMNDFLHD